MKRKKILGWSLIELMITILIASMILTGLTLIYYYATRSNEKGLQRSEAQQAMNTSLDQILKDLRTAGTNVSVSTCGINKEDSIGRASGTALSIYGDFTGDSKIERVNYFLENNICLVRTVDTQIGTGSGSYWVNDPKYDKILIGQRPTGKSKIRVDGASGFSLTYWDSQQTPIPSATPPATLLNVNEKRLVRRINISIKITDKSGYTLSYGMNSTGLLRNLIAPEDL